MSAPGLRYPTVALVVAACGWSLAEGARLIAYEWADAAGRSAYAETPGLGSIALSEDMRRAVAAGGAPSTRQLEALLARTPLAGDVWLDLAAARLAAGRPFVDVEKALAMAHLSAPREAREMVRRATFGLAHWQAFAPATRARLVADLVRGFDHAAEPQRLALAALAATAMPTERADLAARLAARGAEGETVRRALDLDDAPAAPPP